MANGSSINNAHNISLNWTLPTEFELSSGSLNLSLVNITDTDKHYNNISVDYVDLTSTTSGIKTFYLFVQGRNSSGDLIEHPGGSILLNRSVNITFLCYGTSDGVCVSDCGSAQDPDCEPETTTTTTTTNIGGGGSSVASGGGAGLTSAEHSKIIELVRGEEMFFDIEIENKYKDSTLENLKLTLTGFPEQYISISPESLSKILYNSRGRFRIKLTAPSYKSYEEHDLVAIIEGKLVTNSVEREYTETQYIKLIIQEISKEESENQLAEAGEAIRQMKEERFNTIEVEDLLNLAHKKLEEGKNKEAGDLAKEIIKVKETAFRADRLIVGIVSVSSNPEGASSITGKVISVDVDYNSVDLIEKMKENKNWLEEVNINRGWITGNIVLEEKTPINEMIELALLAFDRGDYDLAEERAQDARQLLLLNLKGNLWIFLALNWHIIAFLVLLASVSGLITKRAYKKMSISNRITDIDKEESNISKLMRGIQKAYFSGKISTGDYQMIKKQHQAKLAKLRKQRISLRNKRIKLLTSEKVLEDLEIEKDQVEREVKDLQQSYYRDNKISKDQYNVQFRVLNERLAEIEDERTTIKLMKKRKGG
jgi:hypothetical protein